jgi:hypothetical protein
MKLNIVAVIGEKNDFILAYIPMEKEVNPDLSRLSSDKLEAYWFNSRDGQSKKIGEFKNTDKPEFKPWSVGRGSDFVLVIMDVKSSHRLP